MRYLRPLPLGILILSALSPTIAQASDEPGTTGGTARPTTTLPDRDVEIPGQTGALSGARENAQAKQPDRRGSGIQLPPGQIKAGEASNNGHTVVPADHNGPMVAKHAESVASEGNISVQLAFTPNSAQVLSAMSASGALPAEEYINGDYLYVVYDNGKVLYAGTFNDPLLEHTLARGPQEVHQRKLSEGSIAIRIPAAVLDADTRSTTLQIYTLGTTVQQSEILSQASAQDIAARSTPFGNAIPLARIKAKLAHPTR